MFAWTCLKTWSWTSFYDKSSLKLFEHQTSERFFFERFLFHQWLQKRNFLKIFREKDTERDLSFVRKEKKEWVEKKYF